MRQEYNLDSIIDLFNELDEITDELLALQDEGPGISEKALAFERGPLAMAENKQKAALAEERKKLAELQEIVDEQPRARLNRMNKRGSVAWIGVTDAERKELEEQAALVTPEERKLNEAKAKRVKLPRETVDALTEAATGFLHDARIYEENIDKALSRLSKAAYKLHDAADEVARRKNTDFTLINGNGIYTRLERLRNGDAVGA